MQHYTWHTARARVLVVVFTRSLVRRRGKGIGSKHAAASWIDGTRAEYRRPCRAPSLSGTRKNVGLDGHDCQLSKFAVRACTLCVAALR